MSTEDEGEPKLLARLFMYLKDSGTGSPEDLPALLQSLSDPDYDVRSALANTLATQQDSNSISRAISIEQGLMGYETLTDSQFTADESVDMLLLELLKTVGEP